MNIIKNKKIIKFIDKKGNILKIYRNNFKQIEFEFTKNENTRYDEALLYSYIKKQKDFKNFIFNINHYKIIKVRNNNIIFNQISFYPENKSELIDDFKLSIYNYSEKENDYSLIKFYLYDKKGKLIFNINI